MKNFRLLEANEIEVRLQSFKYGKATFLLYKDARVDMRILDEEFGVFGWERKHEVIGGNLFCTVSVWDEEKGRWINKQDVGVESNTEREKGQASDAFKRACFCLGIGRELYTGPNVQIVPAEKEIYDGKCTLKLRVSEISYNDRREINHLVLVNQWGVEKFRWDKDTPERATKPVGASKTATNTNNQSQGYKLSEAQLKRLYAIAKGAGYTAEAVDLHILKKYNKKPLEMNRAEYDEMCKGYDDLKKEKEAVK